MAVDGGFSGLLCVEENASVFFDENEDSGSVQSSNAIWQSPHNRGFDEAEDGILGPPAREDCLVTLLEKEQQHMPHVDYVNRLRSGDLASCGRNEAIDWIKTVHSHLGFGPLSAYLSVNYLDRFLSAYDLPKGIAWMIQLLAVACLSLAAKVDELDVPLSLDLQVGELKYIFEARTVQRMELLVLSELGWRMQAVTPFSFLDHFLIDMVPPKAAIQILSTIIGDVDFLEFKPSEIAAAVTMSVLGDIYTKRPLLSQHVDKDRVFRCFELISTTVSTKAMPAWIPRSPMCVLDMSWFVYKSTATVCCSQNNKRRKIQRQIDECQTQWKYIEKEK